MGHDLPRRASEAANSKNSATNLRALLPPQHRGDNLAALREENEQLRTLVIELSRIVVRNVYERK